MYEMRTGAKICLSPFHTRRHKPLDIQLIDTRVVGLDGLCEGVEKRGGVAAANHAYDAD